MQEEGVGRDRRDEREGEEGINHVFLFYTMRCVFYSIL